MGRWLAGTLEVLGTVVIPWRAIADLMWTGKTIQQACSELELDYTDVMKVITHDMKSFLLDVSMLANYRDTELLCPAQ